MSGNEAANILAFFFAFPAIAWGAVYDQKYPFWVNLMTCIVFVGPVIVCAIVSVATSIVPSP